MVLNGEARTQEVLGQFRVPDLFDSNFVNSGVTHRFLARFNLALSAKSEFKEHAAVLRQLSPTLAEISGSALVEIQEERRALLHGHHSSL